jgi:hypothetical protein
MKSIFSGLVLVLSTVSALAAVDIVPAPAIGLGLPAIASVILVGLIALLLKR